jgi:hypothetical protein
MDFPLLEITDDALAEQWLHKYFHPNGFRLSHSVFMVFLAFLLSAGRVISRW